MKDSREYTNKDPLVKAIYDILAAQDEDLKEESKDAIEAPVWAEGALNLPNEKELAMAITQLNFLCHASVEIRNHLMNGGGFPEWFQNKLSGLHNTMEDLHSYMAGKAAEDKES